jgi:putative phosphoribosyl transferase
MEPFRDRADAGRQLAARLLHYSGRPGVLVVGLPRGGVPVAYQIAHKLHLPLDILLVRKLGVPGQEELAMGALATGGVRVLNRDIVNLLHITPNEIDAVVESEQRELERRECAYRDGRPPLDVRRQTVILVDDGLATGSSMRAAIQALRHLGAARIVAAVPVAAKATCDELRREVDEMICLREPDDFQAVGEWYYNFYPTSDAEVLDLLSRSAVS